MVGWLKKARAQSRNPDTRREAVQTDPLDTLGQPLAAWAREDTDAGVRCAALLRAADPDLAAARRLEDPDPDTRAAADKLYRRLLTGEHPNAPALPERLARLGQLADAELVEHLACHGAETALREAALKKLGRRSLNLQRLQHDPDPQLRLRLLAGINDAETLERIVTASRRKDKQLHRAARTRLAELQIDAGDARAIRAQAEQLCRELEQLAVGASLEAEVEAIAQRWQAIAAQVDAIVATRFENARARCAAVLTARNAPASAADDSENWPARKLPRMNEPEHPSGQVAASPDEVLRMEAENRFRASLAASGTPLATEPLPSAPAVPDPEPVPEPTPVPKPAPVPFRALLEALESALDAGNLGAATKPLRQLVAQQNAMPPKLVARWQRARARHGELQRWQQWSTRRQRRQLCVDARAMRRSTLHPEAIANRIHELRQAWQKLDALDPPAARKHAANQALARRFHALCQRALEPTRAWFEARAAVRSEHTQRIEELLQQPPEDATDIKALARHRQRLQAARRDLENVDPRQRKSLARKLGRAIERVDAPLDAHHDAIAKAHDRLIEKARGILELAPAERIPAARQLQEQWQALGPGRRDRDRRQWRAFRGAIDAIFTERDQHRKEQTRQREEEQQQAQQLLQHMQAALENPDPAKLGALVEETTRTWRALHVRDKRLDTRFDALRAQLQQRLRHLASETARQRYRDAWAAILAGEDSADAPAAWRAARAQADPAGKPDPEALRTLLVESEAFAQCESPAADQDLRMQLRLQQLQASLAGQAPDARAQLDELIARWLRLAPATGAAPAAQKRFNHAVEAALQRLF